MNLFQSQTFVEHVTDLNDKKQEIRHETKDENPYEEGLKCLQAHDITNAILFFEAAVKKKPDHIDVTD